MKAHYRSECAPLGFIDDIRSKLSPGVCPTCGSASSATVDHVLPKAAWPAFSFFSMNLVPACDQCNRKKGDAYEVVHPTKRPIHPYFDDFLKARLAIIKFRPPYAMPTLEVIPLEPMDDDVRDTVEWHLENVVRKTSISETLGARWLNIVRDPASAFEALEYVPSVRLAIERKLKSLDSIYSTPNNWESMLIAGILADDEAVRYIEERVASGDVAVNPT